MVSNVSVEGLVMNMFSNFFGVESRNKVVEVSGGKFELKYLSEDTPIIVLWFTKYDIAQSTVADDRTARIAPFGENGVACEKRLPGGRNVELFFFEHGELWSEKGYILDDEHLVYMYRSEMRLSAKYHNDVVIFDKKALRNLGYDGNIHFDEEMFYFRSGRSELVSFDYFDYKGNPLTAYKNERIAQEIMLQIRMFVTKDFAHQVKDVEKSQRLSDLTWNATSANIADVHILIGLENSENNLEQTNADKVLTITNWFLSNGKATLFPRYMEFFFTAYEQLSRHDEWTKSQWFGAKMLTKELDDFHMNIYRKVHRNMDLITKRLTVRRDFEELLNDYPKFEMAISELLEEGL